MVNLYQLNMDKMNNSCWASEQSLEWYHNNHLSLKLSPYHIVFAGQCISAVLT